MEINSREHISALALKAAEIMRVQWAREFLIAVFACGSLWRLCWFDRAGGVTHTHFDIESNPEWFACSVLFPLLLPSSELGLAESLSTIKVENQEFILGDTFPYYIMAFRSILSYSLWNLHLSYVLFLSRDIYN